MTQDNRPAPVWADAWEPKTAELAYEAARGTRELMSKWADSLDTKLVATNQSHNCKQVGSVLLSSFC
jgi:hypothetical protein